MVACLILGDSLAQGIGMFRPECRTMAHVGIGSAAFAHEMVADEATGTALISLGVNDSDDAPTLVNLRAVRAKVRAARVYWLLPGIKPRVRALVRAVAVEFDDYLVDTQYEAGADHLHPSRDGYRFLASMVP
jgi:lysophospholipase L1-like esterase